MRTDDGLSFREYSFILLKSQVFFEKKQRILQKNEKTGCKSPEMELL